MKNFILLLVFFSGALLGSAQSDKYKSTMKEKISALDTARDVFVLKDLSAAFERIAEAEKSQWLPYYYAALSEINAGYMVYMANPSNVQDLQKLDPMADRVDQLISRAEALSKDNSEIYTLKKMVATMRMMVNPMERYMKYGVQAQEALETARKLNPQNPRVYYLEGMDKFQTPEQFGGSKTEAKKLFEEALKRYDTYKPVTDLDPNWGRNTVQYFLGQIK